MPKIIDNISIKLNDELNANILTSKRVDFCVGYFNLRGWKEVTESIEKLDGETVVEKNTEYHRFCRLLVGMQKRPDEIIRESFYHDEEQLVDNRTISLYKKQLAREFKEQLTFGTPSETDEFYLKKLTQQLKEKKVVVKLFVKYPLHAKLYLTYDSKTARVPKVGFLGSSNLTLSGLSMNGELNIDINDQDAVNKLENWFNDRWDDRACVDISEELIEIIENSWAGENIIPPYHIYLKMAYHLSQEARAGLTEFKINKQFREELLSFQQMAVKVAAHHLNKRGGVIIGDVVGLGKTITATAVAKILQEEHYLKTLIICPPNLRDMWEDYVIKYDLSAKVISIGEVQKILPNETRFKLVIIDESHNLRNSNGSRYRAIKEYISQMESKVILLSATPYNKSFMDIANQLKLFLSEDLDLGITPEKYIDSIGGPVKFAQKHTEAYIRSIKAFEKSDFADDWRELLKYYMVRRTRSFIKNNYAFTDITNGRKYLKFSDSRISYFPDRIPKKVEYEFDVTDVKDQYAKLYSENVVQTINRLALPRYGLGKYIRENPINGVSKSEEAILENLSRAGKRLMGFCRTNLFKRLESSGYSFLLSISRHILRNYLFLYAIQNRLPFPIGKQISNILDDFIEDQDLDGIETIEFLTDENQYLNKAKDVYRLYESPTFRKRYDWIDSQLFAEDLQQLLINDSKLLIDILKINSNWEAKNDRQLNALKDLISKTHPNEKILIFTQFADTAYYLTEQLKARGIQSLECVTGNSENPTAIAHRFSPKSNKKNVLNEIRILITTDVLSEGQNLQDSHIVVNYDLPWAIIRLIQRAGRVDRIGQQAEQIICYSFLPEDGLEKIINLRKRLSSRIKDNAEVVGSDETFFDGDPININDIYSEKSGILDDADDDQDVDLSSYAYQIWKNATDANPTLKKLIPDLPNVVYSTKENLGDPQREGVVVYSKTADDNDVLTWLDMEGRVITQSQLTILKAAECDIQTPAIHKIETHHDLVRKGIDLIRTDERNAVGTLGKKTGVKYRVFNRLEAFLKENEGTLFANEPLKKALDEIYKFPMWENARETLARELKSGISNEELADLVTSLHEENKLCIIDEHKSEMKEPQIICSLGLKKI